MVHDWKKSIMLLITIIGVVAPIWLWRLDLASKSIAVKIISQTELQPSNGAGLYGVEVLIRGKKVQAPYLTIIEIRNDGYKPIVTTDWELPLELLVAYGSSLESVDVGRRSTESLDPNIRSEAEKIIVAPLLLNPNDSFEVSIVTAGGAPKIIPKSRIVGVSDVSLAVVSEEAQSVWRNYSRLAVGWVSSLLIYPAVGLLCTRRMSLHTHVFACLLILVASYCVLTTVHRSLTGLGVSGIWHAISYATIYISGLAAGMLVFNGSDIKHARA